MEKPERRRQRWPRWLGLVMLFVLMFRLGGVAGLFRPIRVDSASMAPHLTGPHYGFRCDDCLAPLRVDARQHRPGRPLTCWNCGYRGSRGVVWQVLPGQRVWIDRFAYQWRQPRRWDLVALRRKDGGVLAKRVLAFPNEQIGFEDGDLLINGRRVPKSVPQLRRMLIRVHDSRFIPSFAGSPRLWTEDDPDVWRRVDLAWRGKRDDARSTLPSFLHYRHIDTDAAADASTTRQPAPMEDNLNENGAQPRGTVHLVPDVWLTSQMKWSANAVICLRLRTGQSQWDVELDVAAQVYRLRRDGKPAAENPAAIPGYSRGYRLVEWGLCDRRLHLIIDGRSLLSADVVLTAPAGSHANPISVGLRRGELWVARRIISRDVYYFGPDPTEVRWEFPRRLAGLFVAGDNQQASIDSRLLGERLTAETRVWGRVITWPPQPSTP